MHKPPKLKELEGLKEKIQQRWGWMHPLCEEQMTAIEAQLQCKDMLVHAATGFGKTAIAAGPHVHEKCQGHITLMVSPLIALQEDQVCISNMEYWWSMMKTV